MYLVNQYFLLAKDGVVAAWARLNEQPNCNNVIRNYDNRLLWTTNL